MLLADSDIYDARWKLTEARKAIGMVFQKPNPFPAMSIYENVTAGLKLTRARLEQTIAELASEVTIVIVTHTMQQAHRVSQRCAFFLTEQGTPGVIVEEGPTDEIFDSPTDPRTFDDVNGRFG